MCPSELNRTIHSGTKRKNEEWTMTFQSPGLTLVVEYPSVVTENRLAEEIADDNAVLLSTAILQTIILNQV